MSFLPIIVGEPLQRFQVLHTAAQNDTITSRDLVEKTSTTRVTAMRAMRRYVDQGFLKVGRKATRPITFSITAKGQKQLERFEEAKVPQAQAHLARLRDQHARKAS